MREEGVGMWVVDECVVKGVREWVTRGEVESGFRRKRKGFQLWLRCRAASIQGCYPTLGFGSSHLASVGRVLYRVQIGGPVSIHISPQCLSLSGWSLLSPG